MKVFLTLCFKHQLKGLKRKYPNVTGDLLGVLKSVDLRRQVYIGRSIYKIRIKSSDSSRGKSGGFRSYVYLFRKGSLLVPLCIYHKTEMESVSDRDLDFYFDMALKEFS